MQTASLANASLFNAAIAVARLQDWESLDDLTKAADDFDESFGLLQAEAEAVG